MTLTTQQKLDYVENYLKNYFDEFLLKDIKMIDEAKLEFTIPYVLLVSTGIDFFGGLSMGFNKNNVGDRFKYFVNDWLGRINSNYKIQGISELIYGSARCGVSHQSIYKKEVESSSYLYPRDKHLYHIKDFNGEDRIFIHALQLVDDFKKAQDLFRKEYIIQEINSVYDHLNNMLNESSKDFPSLIKELKTRGLTFEAETAVLYNPKIKSYDKITKKIVNNDDEEVRPSAPPPGTN